MERLTDKRLAIPPGQWQEVAREKARELYCRLSQIEDILCDGIDEYDLDRLRELAEADREGRCVVLERAKLEDIPFTYESLISKIIKSET